ncbi:hypothetical protein Tco_1566418 [Tanacetum coccineum]
MANENVFAPAPTRSDDQILPFNAWVPIGKSNYVLDLQKKQRNPILQIFVDILQNTNFFKAFTASAFVLAIYIQQFGIPLLKRQRLEFTIFSNTSGFDRPKYPVLQMLWGIITRTNVNYAKLMWEEFAQAIQTFLADKLIWALLLRRTRRLNLMSPFNKEEDDLLLGNLKFIPKGE